MKKQVEIKEIVGVEYNPYHQDQTIIQITLKNAIPDRIYRVRLSDIEKWYDVDENNYSVKYEIKPNANLYCDDIGMFDTLVNPSFTK